MDAMRGAGRARGCGGVEVLFEAAVGGGVDGGGAADDGAVGVAARGDRFAMVGVVGAVGGVAIFDECGGFEGFVSFGVAGGGDFGFALAVGGFGFFEDVEEVFALCGRG